MGLDMYAFRCDRRAMKSPTELVPTSELPADLLARCEAADTAAQRGDLETAEKVAVAIKIAQWRKHHDLHGWMERLFREKGGEGDFNCQIVELTVEDLNRLDTDITYRRLPQTTGFFFGNNPPDEGSDNADLEFIAKAREAIVAGDAVFYDSWW